MSWAGLGTSANGRMWAQYRSPPEPFPSTRLPPCFSGTREDYKASGTSGTSLLPSVVVTPSARPVWARHLRRAGLDLASGPETLIGRGKAPLLVGGLSGVTRVGWSARTLTREVRGDAEVPPPQCALQHCQASSWCRLGFKFRPLSSPGAPLVPPLTTPRPRTEGS